MRLLQNHYIFRLMKKALITLEPSSWITTAYYSTKKKLKPMFSALMFKAALISKIILKINSCSITKIFINIVWLKIYGISHGSETLLTKTTTPVKKVRAMKVNTMMKRKKVSYSNFIFISKRVVEISKKNCCKTTKSERHIQSWVPCRIRREKTWDDWQTSKENVPKWCETLNTWDGGDWRVFTK